MTTQIEIETLNLIVRNASRAEAQVEALSDEKISVSVFWPETQGEDGDHCHGQNTILAEAHAVMDALNQCGFRHCNFAGRRDMGHSGGTCHFAMSR